MRQARDILKKVRDTLMDEGFVHWTLPELCDWLNFGLDAITLQKPSATAVTVNVPLVRGTLQALPAGYTSMLRPVRNVRTAGSDRLPRKRVTVVSDTMLSAISPSWDDEVSVRFAQQVKHIVYDEVSPKTFYVYPGNDGNGAIEAVLSAIPPKIAASAGSDENSLDSYDDELGLDETYHDALLDYILYRAYSKDAQFAGSANRAGLHYQQFANSLGIKVKVEANTSPNIKTGVPYGSAGVDQTGGA